MQMIVDSQANINIDVLDALKQNFLMNSLDAMEDFLADDIIKFRVL